MSAIATWMARSRRQSGVALIVPVVLVLLLLLLLARPAGAAGGWWPPLVVLPASGRGVSALIVERARRLLVESLGRPNRFRVADFDRPPTADRPGAHEAIALAELTDSRVAVALDVSHDQGQTTLDLRCWDAHSGQLVCHVHESTTAGPELLPDFAEWLTLRVIDQLGATPDAARRGEASAGGLAISSAAPTATGATASGRRAEPRNVTFGVRAAVMVPLDSPSRQTTPLGGFAVLVALDAGYVLASFGFESESGSDAQRMAGAGMDLMMPLGTGERLLPYLGAGAWYVVQKLGGQGANGLQLRPTFGMLLGRHELARVRIETAYFVDLFQEREPDRLIPNSGQAHRTHGLMFSLGVTF